MTEQLRIHERPEPGSVGAREFVTDDRLASEILVIERTIEQCTNGLHHLETALPSLGRQLETARSMLARVRHHLDPRSTASE